MFAIFSLWENNDERMISAEFAQIIARHYELVLIVDVVKEVKDP